MWRLRVKTFDDSGETILFTLFRAGGGANMPPPQFFALTSVKMIESTFSKILADIISKGRGSERASGCTASTQSRQSSTRK